MNRCPWRHWLLAWVLATRSIFVCSMPLSCTGLNLCAPSWLLENNPKTAFHPLTQTPEVSLTLNKKFPGKFPPQNMLSKTSLFLFFTFTLWVWGFHWIYSVIEADARQRSYDYQKLIFPPCCFWVHWKVKWMASLALFILFLTPTSQNPSSLEELMPVWSNAIFNFTFCARNRTQVLGYAK